MYPLYVLGPSVLVENYGRRRAARCAVAAFCEVGGPPAAPPACWVLHPSTEVACRRAPAQFVFKKKLTKFTEQRLLIASLNRLGVGTAAHTPGQSCLCVRIEIGFVLQMTLSADAIVSGLLHAQFGRASFAFLWLACLPAPCPFRPL